MLALETQTQFVEGWMIGVPLLIIAALLVWVWLGMPPLDDSTEETYWIPPSTVDPERLAQAHERGRQVGPDWHQDRPYALDLGDEEDL